MKRKTSTNLIVAILAIVMIFGLVGFGSNQVNGDGIAVTAKDVNNKDVNIKSLEAKIVFFAKDTTDAGNTDGSIDADTNDAAQGEDVNPEDAKDEEKANDDTAPVEIPEDIKLTYNIDKGVIEISDNDAKKIINARESYDGYLQVTAEAEGYYKYCNFDENIKGMPVNSLIIVEENGEAKFRTLDDIIFKKIPTATITFISSDSDNNGLTARDGSSVTSVKVNGEVIKLNEEKVNDQFVKLSIPGSVQKTDKISFALVEGFEIASVSVVGEEGEKEYDSLAAALNNITKDEAIVVEVKKTDTKGPDFDVEIIKDKKDNKKIKITGASTTDKVVVKDAEGKNLTVNLKSEGTSHYHITEKISTWTSYTVTVTDLANNEAIKNVSNYFEVSYDKSFETNGESDPKSVEMAEVKVAITGDLDFKNNAQYKLELINVAGRNKTEVGTIMVEENTNKYSFYVFSDKYKSDDYQLKLYKVNKTNTSIHMHTVSFEIDFDRTAPAIGNVEFTPASDAQKGSYFNTTCTANITVSDTNPWEGTVTYTKDGETQKPVTISSDGTAKIEFADDGVYEITNITVTDKAGNTTVATVKNTKTIVNGVESTLKETVNLGGKFTIDKTAPAIYDVEFTPVSDAQNGSYFSTTRTAEIKVSDTNLSGGTVTYTKNGETQKPVTISSNGTAKIEFADDGVYEITKITVTDKAGNITEATVEETKTIVNGVESTLEKTVNLGGEFTIDKTAPAIGNVEFTSASDAQNGSYFSTTRTAEIKVSDTNLSGGTVTYTKDFTANEDPAPEEIIATFTADENGNITLTMPEGCEETSDAGKITFNKDSIYRITKITVTDKAGNTTEATVKKTETIVKTIVNGVESTLKKTVNLGGEFTIDKTAPVIDNVAFTPASGAQNVSYYNKSRTANITVSDTNLSGGTVTYTKDGEKQEVKISSNGTAEIEFADDGVYEITKITVTDKAGNITEATVEETKTIVNGVESTLEKTVNLGGEFTIDKTAPAIDNVEFTSETEALNESYYNKSRTAEIKVSDTNLSGGTVTYTKDFTANEDPAPEEIIATFTADENGNITLTMPEGCEETSDAGKITFNKDSIYRITKITVTDKAGNTTEATVKKTETIVKTIVNGVESTLKKTVNLGGEFTIDKTDPGVKVEYSEKSGPANGKYFNVIRTATITVTEHNFDKKILIYGNSESDKDFSKAVTSGVHVKIVPVAGDPESDANIKPFAFPTDKNAWKDEGDKHTLTVTYDSNAAYLFEVCVIDMAGNDDKRGLGSPDSNDTDFDFSVDKDIVPPQITGVNNGAAYSGDCVPVITFTDANYASSEVHIFRTRDGQINRDVTAQFGTGLAQNETGGVMTLNRFEKIPENDGIYTIVANMTDMAGNQSEARVTFSINRFGSVYKLGESLADLRGQHVQKIDKDLTITEINPDHLINGSLKVSITRNGKPIETMFSVKPGANNPTIGASGWFEYVYTISASNFKDDGFYTITVSSTDEAGNNSSTSSFEECRMEFWVDSTKSEFTSLIGLEKAIINADKAPVSITVYDEIGIKNITVYCDGVVIAKFEGDDINDINNFEGKFEVPSGRNQVVRIVIEDLSGNITDTEQLIEDGTLPEFMENIQNITVSTNFFVRWFANKLVFFGSIVGVIALGTAAWWFIIGKKRKEVSKEQTSAE